MQAGLVPAASFSSLPAAWDNDATGPSLTWGGTPGPASPPSALPHSPGYTTSEDESSDGPGVDGNTPLLP